MSTKELKSPDSISHWNTQDYLFEKGSESSVCEKDMFKFFISICFSIVFYSILIKIIRILKITLVSNLYFQFNLKFLLFCLV